MQFFETTRSYKALMLLSSQFSPFSFHYGSAVNLFPESVGSAA